MNKDFIFILGGPGSGKGTQSAWIAKHYGIGYLSTGDLLRAAIKQLEDPKNLAPQDLEELRQLAEIMKSGGLVDDKVVINLIKKTMNEGKEVHWFIDGFPRKMTQCELFTQELGDATACLYINVEDSILVQRLLERGKTSGRADDNEESIKKRLETYHNESQEVIDHYKEKGKVIEIDGARSIEEVRQDCIAEIKKIWTVEEIPEEQLQQQEAQEEANKKASKCCLLI